MAASIQVEAGSPLALQIQAALQPKLVELTWAPDENDTTLSEYITMMLVNGKDLHGVQSEIGNELLGMGEDDPVVKHFAAWLFERVHEMIAPPAHQQQEQQEQEQGMEELQGGEQAQQPQLQQLEPEMPTADSQMDDASATPPLDGAPVGPKAMRQPARRGARGGRMLNQMNRQMDRSTDAPDSLRRIKGAASGAGRINAHHAIRDGAPRGPRTQNAAAGVQRMMNGGGRGAHTQGAMNPAMQQAGMMNALPADQQVFFMQMMEMQANMMANMLQTGQIINNHNGTHPASQNGDTMDTSISESGEKKTPFDQLCHYNLGCTNPTCKYAHQSPAAPPGTTIDMSDTCTHGAACTNKKCTARHPSPAQRAAFQKAEVECKFYPNCTMGPACPFKHPDMPPCRNGPDCQVEGCRFSHSKIMCRYNPCLNPACQYRHQEGQKRGNFEDKVWVPDQQNGAEGERGTDGTQAVNLKAERFAELMQDGQAEELIKPDSQELEHVNITTEAEMVT